jgi:ribonucleoside-diphosphate reductase alpha chain
MIPLESLEAHLFNIQLFKKIDSETKRASTFLAELFGEAPICKGYGYANALRIAVAPNLSSALICGGVSQGAEPIYKNAYIQHTASGKVTRVNPKLLSIMKERLDSTLIEGEVNSIIDNSGSVKDVHWLSDHEKQVFKTAFEIDQRTLIRLANERQKYIDQGQSLNLFFSANEDEEYIAKVHKEAITSEYIKGLYYVRSETGVSVSKNGCVACEG